MSEYASERSGGGFVNQAGGPGMGKSFHELQKQLEAARAQHPATCVPPGMLLAHLSQRLVDIVQKATSQIAAPGFGLTHLVLAAVDLADCSYREISVHTTAAGPDLVRAVDRIIDSAQRFFEANTPRSERDAALECARALEAYGLVLVTKYGSAAEAANTQLRALWTRLLASTLRPALWN